MRRFLDTRVIYFLLSLAIATVMWLYVATAQNPVVDRTMVVDLHVRGLSSSQVVVQAPPRVQVRLQGPRSAISGLTPALLDASVDLTGLRPGEHRVLVEVAVPPDVRVAERIPAEALVVLDALTRHRFPVQVSMVGAPPSDLAIGAPRASPSAIVASGALTQVREVQHALVTVDAPKLREQRVFTLSVRIVDATGQEVHGLTIEPPLVEVTVPVQEGVITKVVPVVPTVVGTPFSSLAVAGAAADPGTVTLTGPVSLLQQVQAVPTAAVDVSRARGDVTRRVALQLPAGVTASVRQATVVVRIGRALLSTILTSVSVKVTGLASGTVSNVAPNRVEIQVEGPQDLIQRLNAQAVVVEVDAAHHPPGQYRITPRAVLPPGVHVLAIRPAQVLVTIRSS